MTIAQDLESKFKLIKQFVRKYPNQVPTRIGSDVGKLHNYFIKGREVKHPKQPETTTDKAVYQILESYFDYSATELDKLVQAHKDAMAAENIVGDLLERFIAQVLEPHGWVWCSGGVIKAVDFIKKRSDGTWILLQIKNRDNSENSSSKSVRDGTDIQKWFRSFSKKEAFNWDAFPLPRGQQELKAKLTEDEFRKFIKSYIKKMKGS